MAPSSLDSAMIAVAVVAGFSAAVTGTFLLYFAILSASDLLKRRKRQVQTSYSSETHPELQRVRNQFSFFMFNMIIFDFLSALGFGLTGRWVTAGNRPEVGQTNAFCELQGVLITFGDLGSGLFACVIALHTFIVLGTKHRMSRRTCGVIAFGTWLFAIALEIIGPLSVGSKERPYYAFSRVWCFASNDFELVRLFTHYLWIFASFFTSIVIYGALFLHFKRYYKRSRDTVANELLLRTAKTMLLYPLVYGVCAMPAALYRLAQLTGRTGPIEVLAFGGIAFSCAGTLNVLLYGLTRNVINMKLVKARIKSGRGVVGDITIRTEQVVTYEGLSHVEKPQTALLRQSGQGFDETRTLPIELYDFARPHLVTFQKGAVGWTDDTEQQCDIEKYKI